jgi:hypothetical protein
MIIIDGVTFDVPIKRITRRADFLDKYAERTEDGNLQRELIGVYFNYQLEFGRTNDLTEYAALWDKLTEPVEFHEVTVPDEDGDFTYTAYFSNVGDDLIKSKDAGNFWKNLTVNFTARTPARV